MSADDLASAIRPRERLLRYGPHTLTDAELLAVLLSVGHAGANALTVADRVLRVAGGVPGLARQHPEALSRLPGLGRAAAGRLVAALALPARRDPMGTVTVTGVEDLIPVFRSELTGLRHERLAVAVCDRRCRVLAVRAVSDGDSCGAPLPLRDIVATVLRHDGHAFAIAHNHPSGDATPSTTDRQATMRCRGAADAAGLRFLGHVVIGEHDGWAAA